jgi:hypothetical protein
MAVNSGATKHHTTYPIRRQKMWLLLSSSPGRFGWIAVQVPRKIVEEQLQSRPIVPRPWGAGAHPTKPVVEFIGLIRSQVISGALQCGTQRSQVKVV